MNSKKYLRWISLLGIVILVVLAVSLKYQNRELEKKNEVLILQNDSILSVKIKLEKDLERLKHRMDSASQNKPASYRYAGYWQ